MIGNNITDRHCLAAAVLIFGFVLMTAPLDGVTIDATGDWGLSIGREDLAGGAGSDLRENFESSPNASTVDIGDTSGGTWSVTVRRSGVEWPEEARMYVRRTSTGTFDEDQTISGGTAYQEITLTDSFLFQGSGDGSGVTLQYRVTGVSVSTSAGIYDTTLHLEITE